MINSEIIPDYKFGNSFFDALEKIIITEDNIEFFIGVLVTTDNYNVRNQLSLKIADTKNPKLIEPLINLIKNPKTYNHRGSLVGALMEYDYLPYMDLLVNIMNENFELRWRVDTMLRESIDKLSDEQKKRYIDIINKEIDECDYKRDVLESLSDDLKNTL